MNYRYSRGVVARPSVLIRVVAKEASVGPDAVADDSAILGVMRSKPIAGAKLPSGFTLGRKLCMHGISMWSGYCGYEPAPTVGEYGIPACKHSLRFNSLKRISPPLLPVSRGAPQRYVMDAVPARFVCVMMGQLFNKTKGKEETRRWLLWVMMAAWACPSEIRGRDRRSQRCDGPR